MTSYPLGGLRPRLLTLLLASALTTALLIGPSPQAAAAPAETVPEAIAAAVAHSKSKNVFTYISVVDRQTGLLLGESPDANKRVASESISKLFVAAYWLKKYPLAKKMPARMLADLDVMLRYSDNAATSRLWRNDVVTSVAKRYGLSNTKNAPDRVGHWGAVQINAHDMAKFMYEAGEDPDVGPWLLWKLAQTAPHGRGGDRNFNQEFGLNALTGEHGGKQGWGLDSFFTVPHGAIHSVGYTDKYYVAILQLTARWPDPARSTATFAAKRIQAAQRMANPDEFGCPPYLDVLPSNVHCANIAWLKDRNITKPVGELYGPHNTVSRSQMAAFLFRIAHPDTRQPACSEAPFRDVPTSHPFCGYIAWAASERIAYGYDDDRYGPDRPVTRGAMAAYLARLAGVPSAPCAVPPFEDVPVDDTFCPVIAWAVAAGITYGVGDGTEYGTTDPVTRASMASFLRRVDTLLP